MATLFKNIFLALSQNKLLSKGAQKWGLKLGAEQFVAGTNVDSAINSVRRLNDSGISATVDHLGEFVTEQSVSIKAKENIIDFIENIQKYDLDCHISVKLTQLGLDIDEGFCLSNIKEILDKANEHKIFINIDTEDYLHYEQGLNILNQLKEEYNNVGTVIQSYLYRAEEDMDNLKNVRLRIVKGAYKESEEVAFQNQEDIDRNFINLVKKRLIEGVFTSIATHDHHIINEIKAFVAEKNINKSNFEFQMLYGFRKNLQNQLKNKGYQFCIYIPFGDDWYGYFMRRLAERPQNLNLILKDKLYTEDNKIKKTPIIALSAFFASILYLVFRKRK